MNRNAHSSTAARNPAGEHSTTAPLVDDKPMTHRQIQMLNRWESVTEASEIRGQIARLKKRSVQLRTEAELNEKAIARLNAVMGGHQKQGPKIAKRATTDS
jgi:hypothetical protein